MICEICQQEDIDLNTGHCTVCENMIFRCAELMDRATGDTIQSVTMAMYFIRHADKFMELYKDYADNRDWFI